MFTAGPAFFRGSGAPLANVISLLPMDTDFIDAVGVTWNVAGPIPPVISTDESKFGTGSGKSVNNGGTNISAASDINGAIGDGIKSGPYTFEMFIWPIAAAFEQAIFVVGPGPFVGLFLESDGSVNYYDFSTLRISSAGKFTFNAWNYFAVTRDAGGVTRLFVNGNLEATTFTSTTDMTGRSGIIFNQANGAEPISCYANEWRVSNICRYTSTFTPPTVPFPT